MGFIQPTDQRWPEALRRVPHDYFHLPGFAQASARHEGGEPLLFLLDQGEQGMLVPLLRRSLVEFGDDFAGFYDVASPYGYPGPLYWGDDWQSRAQEMHDTFYAFLLEEKVVSLFLRLNPFVGAPGALLAPSGRLATHGPAVFIDLDDPERSWKGINVTNRRFILRMLNAGCRVEIDRWDTMEEVVSAYYESMKRVDAAASYFFPREFFRELRESTCPHLHLATAFSPSGEIMAGSFFTEVGGLIQYYLMGTFEAFMEASPSKLIINAIRLWGHEHGHHKLNLGGGVGSRRDGLFEFKLTMSKFTVDFSTFRKVFLPDVFKALAHSRGWKDLDDDYFPVYRKPSPQ